MNNAKTLAGRLAVAMIIGVIVMMFAGVAAAQQGGTIELEVIEIESDVPRRVAQFFVQRDRLHYQPVERQPSFLPELLKSVEREPF